MSLKIPAMITNRVNIPSSWFVLCIVSITQITILFQHLNLKYLTVKLQTENKHNLICIYRFNIRKIQFDLYCINAFLPRKSGRQTNWSEHDSRLARTPGYTQCFSMLQFFLNVTQCYSMLLNVTQCYSMLLNATQCYSMFLNVTQCYCNITHCYSILLNVTAMITD